MSARQRLAQTVAEQVARRGFELKRHPATRRQAVMATHEVDLVLDVGAADGGYGTALRDFGFTGSILSFEPQASAFGRLAALTRDDQKWSARQVALGSEEGEVLLNIASNSTSSSVLPMLEAHIDAAPSVQYVGTETVPVARLDDVAREAVAAHARTFLKIDTQGFEREVLAGGPETVQASVGLQLELSLVPLYGGGMVIDEAMSWAYDHGFHMVGLEQGYAAPSGEILQIDGIFVRD